MNKKREKKRERVERGRRISKLGRLLVDSNSSVEVGYGFYAIRSRLLIANDMCWVVL